MSIFMELSVLDNYDLPNIGFVTHRHLLTKSITLELDDVLSKFSKIKVRPYQKKCIEEILPAISSNRAAALLLPTGMGKSMIYLPVAITVVDKGYRVCILCATNLLIGQIKNVHPQFQGEDSTQRDY